MFYFDDFYGKKILKSTLLSDYDCFFTTRDLVLTSADKTELEEESNKNRLFLKEKLNCKEIYSAKQVHGTNAEIITEGNYFYDSTDALISDLPNSVLLLNFADCVPVILYSKKDNTGAVIHAGWRGTANEIALKTVKKIEDKLNINPKDITALIGPAIGKCCFETGKEVFKKLVTNPKEKDLYTKNGEKYNVDLKKINYNQLKEAGVENIDTCSYCTCCMSDIFFSYRKEKGITARHSAIIKIKGEKICL